MGHDNIGLDNIGAKACSKVVHEDIGGTSPNHAWMSFKAKRAGQDSVSWIIESLKSGEIQLK